MLEECDACPEPAAAILQHELRGLCTPVLIRRALDQVARLHVGWHRQAAALARWPGPCHVFSRRQATVCRWTSLKPQERPAARVPTTRGAHAPLVGGTGGGGMGAKPRTSRATEQSFTLCSVEGTATYGVLGAMSCSWDAPGKAAGGGGGRLGGGRQPSSGPENRHFCFLAEAKAHAGPLGAEGRRGRRGREEGGGGGGGGKESKTRWTQPALREPVARFRPTVGRSSWRDDGPGW